MHACSNLLFPNYFQIHAPAPFGRSVRPHHLKGENDTSVGGGLDYENMYEDSNRRGPNRAPSATVPPFSAGRGPSQAADFFSARGAPSILEVKPLSFCRGDTYRTKIDIFFRFRQVQE